MIVSAAGAFSSIAFSASVDTVHNSKSLSDAEEVLLIEPLTDESAGNLADSAESDADQPVMIEKTVSSLSTGDVFEVPFYSQFVDITPVEWRKIGCGIASLAMLVDFYKPAVSVDVLLQEGINSGAYIQNAGWSHQGLINLAKDYGLVGKAVGLSDLSMEEAFGKLEDEVGVGPVIVSVHYTFQPTNPIPHLVVVNGVKDGLVYYNDPAEEMGGGSISIEQFQSAWKKRFIKIRPIG